MTTEKSEVERLKNRSDNEIISDNLSIITKYFHDIFDKYNFKLNVKTIDSIQLENDDFKILFGYERNRYGMIDFNGIMIGIKDSGMRYGINYIVDVLSNNSSETFDQRFYSMSNMSGEERYRVLWNDYVDETLRDPKPKWEKEIPMLLKQRFPDFF